MQQHLDYFESLKVPFADDYAAIATIDQEIQATQEWIHEHESEVEEAAPRQLQTVDMETAIENVRSIFDDIDEDENAGED